MPILNQQQYLEASAATNRLLASGAMADMVVGLRNLAREILPYEHEHGLSPAIDRTQLLERPLYKQALKGWQESADRGRAEGHYVFGYLLARDWARGLHNTQDGRKYLMKAAAQGDADASCELGNLHNGFPWESPETAKMYYKQAAEKEHGTAQYRLAQLHFKDGRLRENGDLQEAVIWYESFMVNEQAQDKRDAAQQLASAAGMIEEGLRKVLVASHRYLTQKYEKKWVERFAGELAAKKAVLEGLSAESAPSGYSALKGWVRMYEAAKDRLEVFEASRAIGAQIITQMYFEKRVSADDPAQLGRFTERLGTVLTWAERKNQVLAEPEHREAIVAKLRGGLDHNALTPMERVTDVPQFATELQALSYASESEKTQLPLPISQLILEYVGASAEEAEYALKGTLLFTGPQRRDLDDIEVTRRRISVRFMSNAAGRDFYEANKEVLGEFEVTPKAGNFLMGGYNVEITRPRYVTVEARKKFSEMVRNLTPLANDFAKNKAGRGEQTCAIM